MPQIGFIVRAYARRLIEIDCLVSLLLVSWLSLKSVLWVYQISIEILMNGVCRLLLGANWVLCHSWSEWNMVQVFWRQPQLKRVTIVTLPMTAVVILTSILAHSFGWLLLTLPIKITFRPIEL